MLFIGDVHGLWRRYEEIIAGTEDDTLQIGDMGIGFGRRWPKRLPAKDRFIRGNHDNPHFCRRHPNYLGEYGFDAGAKMFFLSGAWSIDQLLRTPELDWWPEEELSAARLKMAAELYRESKPAIVATHDCPTSVFKRMMPGRDVFVTRTGDALQEMLDAHVPDVWLFGHHHVLWKGTIGNCQFICLDELSTHSMPDVKWTK